MSRGYWNYKNENLKDEIFGWGSSNKSIPNIFEDKEISEIVWDIFDLLYAFDSYKSGDWNEDSWLEKKNDFKEKWLSRAEDERIKKIVDAALKDAKDEIYKTFNIKEN